jgi:hypothetical protein
LNTQIRLKNQPETERTPVKYWKVNAVMDGLRKRMGLLSLVIILLLTGCIQYTFSPERAAIREVLSPHHVGQTFPDTVEVLQSKELNGIVLVLIKFQMLDEEHIRDCVFFFETKKRNFEWISGRGRGSCFPGPMEDQQVSMGRGFDSKVFGVVHDTEIISMEVRWEDEMVQREDVINGSFLAIREGKHKWSEVTGLDADGTVIYSMK